ncbi:MAG TPA: TIGR03668 family PPOX class F420-dependent oxidoreductase [Candidatus Dormibacteraeota bacterium]
MDQAAARERFATSRVAHLGTVDESGRPHIVPITFAIASDTIYFAVDQKPKRTSDLQRLRNIKRNPRVAVLVDHYSEDWRALWWARADGTARVLEKDAEASRAIEMLVERYAQYREAVPGGPVVAIHVERWSGWSFT